MGILPNQENATALSPERAAAVRSELASILKSSYFSGSKRCQDFLEFIVNHAIDGNFEYLTERFLGAELFGRPINYETGTDSIVRVRANDARRRLAQFYAEGYGGSRVTIGLVSGSYIPEFHWGGPKTVEAGSTDTGPTALSAGPDASLDATVTISPKTVLNLGRTPERRRLFIGLIASALAVGGCIGWWMNERVQDRVLYPLKYAPAMGALWSGLMDANHETDVVLSDASFQLLQDIGKRSFNLDEYLSRSYVGQLQEQNSSPEMQFVLSHIASKNFGNSVEFRLAQRISALDRMGNKVLIYNAHEYTTALVMQDNIVLIGSQYTNPWQQLFSNQLNFLANPPNKLPGSVINRAPRAGESSTYMPTDAVGYCVVAYLPNPDRNTKVLIIEGSSSEATEAGGDFLLSEQKLAALDKMLHTDRLPYFEVLFKTSQVRGTPITATVEAYRTYPSSH
jgi:hypothetical protein